MKIHHRRVNLVLTEGPDPPLTDQLRKELAVIWIGEIDHNAICKPCAIGLRFLWHMYSFSSQTELRPHFNQIFTRCNSAAYKLTFLQFSHPSQNDIYALFNPATATLVFHATGSGLNRIFTTVYNVGRTAVSGAHAKRESGRGR
jgi:hypothetical protein